MPIDSIEYFGVIDTADPKTGAFTPKIITNQYTIPSPIVSGYCRVELGIIPNSALWTTATQAEVIDPLTGLPIVMLTAKRTTSIPLDSVAIDEIYLIDIDGFNSSVFVNSAYAGKLLILTSSFDSCTVNGSWMNIVGGHFMQVIAVGQTITAPKGSWFPCVPSTVVNQWLYPKYKSQMTLMGNPYGVDAKGNPYTPNLRGKVLAAPDSGITGMASIGYLQNKFLFPRLAAPHNEHRHNLDPTNIKDSEESDIGSRDFRSPKFRFDGPTTFLTSNSISVANPNADISAWHKGGGITNDSVILSNSLFSPHYGVIYYIKVV